LGTDARAGEGTVHEEPVVKEGTVDLGYLAGMAKVDMTPDLARFSVSLNGYGDRKRGRATGVLDPVFARALVVSDARGGLAAVVAVDLCYVVTDLRDGIIEELQSQGFTQDNLLLSATHTHSSFTGYDGSFVAKVLMGSFQEKVFDHTVDAVVRAVTDAKKAMRPAQIFFGSREVDGLNRSRLDPAFEHGLGKNTQSPSASKFPTNKRLSVLHVKSREGGDIGAVVHFSAHPTALSPKNMSISPDFPGVVCNQVEQELGPGSVAVFLNGSLGDMAPSPDWEDAVATEVKQMREYGGRLADAAVEMLPRLEALKNPKISCRTVRGKYRNVWIRPLGRLELPGFLSKAFYTNGEMAFQAMALGGLVFLGVPGEVTTTTGRNLEAVCPPEQVCLVVSPANGYTGYIVTPNEYEVDGYESDSCLFGPHAADRAKSFLQKAMDGLE